MVLISSELAAAAAFRLQSCAEAKASNAEAHVGAEASSLLRLGRTEPFSSSVILLTIVEYAVKALTSDKGQLLPLWRVVIIDSYTVWC